MRRIVAAVFAAFIACTSLPASAQSDSGEITIAVTDAQTKQAVGLARVLLDGAVITSELTGTNGKVTFTDVPDGIYRCRVIKRGYRSLTSESFEVLDGRLVTVSMALEGDTGNLKVIGTVQVKASVAISSTSIDQNSAQRRLSDDLAGALNKLSGVSVTTSSDDSDATQTVSLEGHDASQTQLTLDGIPLNAPGSAGNLNSFATDLFQGASVHTGATLGGLGGSVNFSTLQPTLSWMSQASLSAGSYGKYNYSLAETGSLGKLGLAVQTVDRETPSLADNLFYLDGSGLDYSHDGNSETSGNLIKARYEFGDSNSITGTFLNSTRDTSIICLREGAPPALPCGYGPNNSSESSTQLYALTDNALVGATELQASVYSTTQKSFLDQLERYVDISTGDFPIPDNQPNAFDTLMSTKGFSINATLPAQQRHTISIQAYGSTSENLTTPLIEESAPYYFGGFNTSYDAISVSDTIHSSDKLTLADSVGISTATGSGGVTALGSLAATWKPTTVDTYNASYSLGGVAATMGRSQILSDPASLRFTCAGTPAQDTAFGSAPGDNPGPSSSISYRAGYTRTFKGGNVSLQLYRQIQSGVLLPIDVNGTILEQQGLLPIDYLQQVQQLFNSAAGCNVKDAQLAASQLYFSTPISGIRRVYQGAELTGYATAGDLVIQPFYNLIQTTAISNSPYLDNPYSIVLSGYQLPNQPLQRGGIVLDYKAPHSMFEWLADAQYTGRNNPNNLPAYTTFDAGVTANLNFGTLTLAASNITNTYAGIFSSPKNAVPYTTLAGYVIPTIARPLQPSQISVTYTARFGPGATNSQSSSAYNPARSRSGGRGGFGAFGGGFGGEGGPPPGGPPAGGPNGNGGGSGQRPFFAPLPTSPPADPLAVAADPSRCNADDSAKAKALSDELKAYVARIEAAKSAAGYPATMAAPAIADASVTYHGLGSTYALTIVPKGTTRLRALAGCFALHIARADDVTQRKLYAPQTTLFFAPQLSFMPAVGLYFVARQQQAGQESFRVYKLPTTPPKTPFEVRAGDSCTGDAKNLASQALNELNAYFVLHGKAPTWTITPHTASGGTWYELSPSDPTVFGAILQCGRVAATTADELKQKGFDGRNVPEMNYTPSLGLYFVRPTRPPGANGNRGNGSNGANGGPNAGGAPPPPPE
jgi:hypothetical protein